MRPSRALLLAATAAAAWPLRPVRLFGAPAGAKLAGGVVAGRPRQRCQARQPRPWAGPPPRRRVARAAADPNFAANVGKAIDTLREDHARLPEAVPGLAVADPGVALDLAQLPALSFRGLAQYREFWGNFRSGVQLVSTSARSEVVQVVHSGLYVRLRWRLLLSPRAPPGGEVAAGALRAARASLVGQSSTLGSWLQRAGDGLLGEAEQWAASQATGVPEERTVELNSIYELDCWSGRVVRHTLEFRSPGEDFGLLGALQGVPSYR